MKTLILFLAVFTVMSQDRVGGWQNQNVAQYLSDNSNSKAFEMAVLSANQMSGRNYQLEKVVFIRTQIVAGQNTEYSLSFQDSTNANLRKFIKVIVFEQAWTNTLQVSSIEEMLKP